MVIETKFWCDVSEALIKDAVEKFNYENEEEQVEYEFARQAVVAPENLLYFAMTQHDDHSDPNADPEQYVDWVIEECVMEM